MRAGARAIGRGLEVAEEAGELCDRAGEAAADTAGEVVPWASGESTRETVGDASSPDVKSNCAQTAISARPGSPFPCISSCPVASPVFLASASAPSSAPSSAVSSTPSSAPSAAPSSVSGIISGPSSNEAAAETSIDSAYSSGGGDPLSISAEESLNSPSSLSTTPPTSSSP